MYLYLIRHGIAIERDPNASDSIENDELRSLTKTGRKKATQVAEKLVNFGLTFDLIMTSPLVRARQTADIFIDLQLSSRLEVSTDLKPQGNLPSWLVNWNARADIDSMDTIALVGHEPNLSEWAELLIFGKIYHRLILKKAGIIGLEFTNVDATTPPHRLAIGTAQLYCLMPPKLTI
jgi:phosphohistidine phosphatase